MHFEFKNGARMAFSYLDALLQASVLPVKPHRIEEEKLLRKTAFLRHLYLKTIILPRQARDKHRESTPKKMWLFSHRRAVGKRAVFLNADLTTVWQAVGLGLGEGTRLACEKRHF
eukprot:COSAG06_NODE_20913_length_776_cov_2.901034_1_plen_115_part_00